LIEGIEKFGFGNWNDIAEHIGSKKAIDVEEHYEETYINNKVYNLFKLNYYDKSLNL
jgi:hypothetical protein